MFIHLSLSDIIAFQLSSDPTSKKQVIVPGDSFGGQNRLPVAVPAGRLGRHGYEPSPDISDNCFKNVKYR
jgi:hypothetical protein